MKIGKQIWLANNLNINQFRNGDLILHAKSAEEWKKAGEKGKPAMCYYDNDSNNGKYYSKLYNWYAVNDPRGISPEGWHIPNNDEWDKLITFYGGNTQAGTSLKSSHGWDLELNGTNESCFDGLPGGYREENGIFKFIGAMGHWWSASDGGILLMLHPNTASIYTLYGVSPTSNFATGEIYASGEMNRNNYSVLMGLSVRCLKD